jgi:hypothetical protein
MDFTYEIPNEERYLSAVIMRLKDKINAELLNILSKSKCTINPASTYSNSRWNAYYTTVDFAVNQRDYDKIIALMNHSETKLIVQWTCNEVMPAKVGFDIMDVTVSISLEDITQPLSTMQDLKNIIKELPSKVKDAVIPEDILEKAKEMSEVYLYTYCVENALRAFIVMVADEKLGADYLTNRKLQLSKDMLSKISKRKEQQEKKKWLSARGNSDIFYLDIEDLGNLIQNNWNIFEQYFESTQWIMTNISEIADCRNTIAHHGYLQEHERDIIRINFIKILKQISEKLK